MSPAKFLSLPTLALALGWVTPAQAQSADAAAVQHELAAMRAQMQRMAERIDSLESQLAAEQAANTAQVPAAEAAAAQAPSPATAKAEASPPKIAWKAAPEISGEGGWSFKPRGRIQLDAGVVDAPARLSGGNNAHLGFAAEARRLYLGFEGTTPGGFGYRLEADLASSGVSLTDAFLTYKPSRNVLLTLGHHKPFWGLEEMTSDNFTSMMERASFNQAFGFERRLGVSAAYATDTFLVQGGLFTDDLDTLNADDARSWSVDGRVVAMPRVGGGTLHIGASAHLRELRGSTTSTRYRARPFLHTPDVRLVDTGAFAATGERSFGGELAYIAGRFHATVEGHMLTVRRAGLPDPTFMGAYAEVGYLLTDDETGYKGGVYERIKPKRPVGKGGLGALQVNARYDWLDLTDAGRNGGRQQTAGLSLVWVPTDYVRFIANYGHVWVRGAPVTAAGDPNYSVDAFGLRGQIDF